MNTNILTYGDLLYIRDLLIADQQDTNRQSSVNKWETLTRVETMIDHAPQTPNAETLAAMEEAKNWRNLPAYKSVDELMQALKDDD